MEVAIREAVKDAQPPHVFQLVLDKYRLPRIEADILRRFTELKVLTLNGVGLSSLENFPCLPKLEKLELSDNLICGGLHHLKELSSLVSLNLSGNRLEKMSELEPLSHLERLENLDLFGCAVTSTPDYHVIVFSMIPSLKALDRWDMSVLGLDRVVNAHRNLNGVHVVDDEDENTQEDIQWKDRPKTRPPPQNGKLFRDSASVEELSEYQGGGSQAPIRLDLDTIVTSIRSSQGNQEPPRPKTPPPERDATYLARLQREEPTNSGDSSDDEDFDPSDNESEGDDVVFSEGDDPSEDDEEMAEVLKRSREDGEEHVAKRSRQ